MDTRCFNHFFPPWKSIKAIDPPVLAAFLVTPVPHDPTTPLATHRPPAFAHCDGHWWRLSGYKWYLQRRKTCFHLRNKHNKHRNSVTEVKTGLQIMNCKKTYYVHQIVPVCIWSHAKVPWGEVPLYYMYGCKWLEGLVVVPNLRNHLRYILKYT